MSDVEWPPPVPVRAPGMTPRLPVVDVSAFGEDAARDQDGAATRAAIVDRDTTIAAHKRHAATGDPACPMCVFTADGFKTDNCGTCHAPIVWATTEAGKSMPVDAEIVPDGNVTLVAPTTRWPNEPVIAVVLDQESLFGDGPRRVSHFATCPDADAWRSKRVGSR